MELVDDPAAGGKGALEKGNRCQFAQTSVHVLHISRHLLESSHLFGREGLKDWYWSNPVQPDLLQMQLPTNSSTTLQQGKKEPF
jgi:hypothetical protein